jgi:sugar lactone lactonase YvrE
MGSRGSPTRNRIERKAGRGRVIGTLVLFLALTVAAMAPGGNALAFSSPGRLWVARYNGPGNGADQAADMALSPDGSRVYVTGSSAATGTGLDYATAAYDASTGAELWVARYNGPGSGDDQAVAMALSPDGTRVYATGSSAGTVTGLDYATAAYDASTGAELWVARYNGPGNGDDGATSVAVSPTGSRVYVTGGSAGVGTGPDYATVAYRASTGTPLMAARYNGPGNGDDHAVDLGVSPDGSRVYVTGASADAQTDPEYATLAYDASTGASVWLSRYDGCPIFGIASQAVAIAVSPDGSRVFVTGTRYCDNLGFAHQSRATLAYDASTGAQQWEAIESGGGEGVGFAWARDLEVSPDGSRVYVTGETQDHPNGGRDYTTDAYHASTGALVWEDVFGPEAPSGTFVPLSLGVSPDGSLVYVTGTGKGMGRSTFDYATVAYDASSGDQLGVAYYNGPGNRLDEAFSLAVSPDGSRVSVTGGSVGVGTGLDYATIAYAVA